MYRISHPFWGNDPVSQVSKQFIHKLLTILIISYLQYYKIVKIIVKYVINCEDFVFYLRFSVIHVFRLPGTCVSVSTVFCCSQFCSCTICSQLSPLQVFVLMFISFTFYISVSCCHSLVHALCALVCSLLFLRVFLSVLPCQHWFSKLISFLILPSSSCWVSSAAWVLLPQTWFKPGETTF